ncbi:hypothetical protein P873_04600 [Arenimonas composti TR7-09 = DSM 18010]|uniref:VCBS repeat-containing protein n=1 Tax=Arenimonas composti TR7-09 = DSM 18010 TaxID=1121013 RepID=A0A091C326_9GAMM|nr:hypothetical protein P873_04600 [Arenimonas composti TR7-09 = DSM 18010]
MNTSFPRTASRTRRLVACAILSALLPGFAGAAPWAACAGEVLRAPPLPERTEGARFGGLPEVPSNPVGCLFGLSMQVDADTVLWRCMIDSELQEAAVWESEDGSAEPPYARDDGRVDEQDPRNWSYALLLLRNGQPVQAWRDSLMGGRYDAFALHRVDLDGDGVRENLVTLWNAQGNGLGVNHWTLRVFSDDWRLLDSRAGVADWGPGALRAAPAPRGGCDIGVTSWVEDRSTGRDGIALEARFLRLQDGRLVEAADRPPERRRYTFGFQNQRTAWFDADPDRLEGDIAGWLGGD